jgi:hypothetical protein
MRPLRGAIDALLFDLKEGHLATSFRSELERELWFAMHPPKRRKAA